MRYDNYPYYFIDNKDTRIKLLGIRLEQVKGELKNCRNANKQYYKVIKDLNAELKRLRKELEVVTDEY